MVSKIKDLMPMSHQGFRVLIVGRPNVGKSSLINRFMQRHHAVVSEHENTTLDLQFLPYAFEDRGCVLIDSAGWTDHPEGFLVQGMERLQAALPKVDWIWWVVDGREALRPWDWQLAEQLRVHSSKVLLLINKMDSDGLVLDPDIWRLGHLQSLEVSARSGRHLALLREQLHERLRMQDAGMFEKTAAQIPSVALVGKPNAGKSTLFNTWLGAEIQVMSEHAGTTRDVHAHPADCLGQPIWLLDTAGLRRSSKREGLERIFAQHAERVFEQEDVLLVLIRADEWTEQDRRLLRQAYQQGRGMVILWTQCDRLEAKARELAWKSVTSELFQWYPGIDVIPYSVKDPKSLRRVQAAVLRSIKSLQDVWTSARLTRILELLVQKQPPPYTSVSRIKPRFAHPMQSRPGHVVVRGKQLEDLPPAYRRYLQKGFVEGLRLQNRALHVSFLSDSNPFEEERA